MLDVFGGPPLRASGDDEFVGKPIILLLTWTQHLEPRLWAQHDDLNRMRPGSINFRVTSKDHEFAASRFEACNFSRPPTTLSKVGSGEGCFPTLVGTRYATPFGSLVLKAQNYFILYTMVSAQPDQLPI